MCSMCMFCLTNSHRCYYIQFIVIYDKKKHKLSHLSWNQRKFAVMSLKLKWSHQLSKYLQFNFPPIDLIIAALS